MDELRESSLLFSLERLHETERQRVEREAREAQRRREQEQALVAEVAEQRRRAAEEQRAAALRLKALQAERERLEQECLQAMQRATVERATSEVEASAQARRAELEHEHRFKLSQIRERERGARYRVLSWLGAAGLVVISSLGFGGYFGVLRPAQLQRERHFQTLLDQSERARKAREKALLLERKKLDELEAAFRELDSKRTAAPVGQLLKPGASRQPAAPSRARRAAPPCPDNGDPLQGCLGAGRSG